MQPTFTQHSGDLLEPCSRWSGLRMQRLPHMEKSSKGTKYYTEVYPQYESDIGINIRQFGSQYYTEVYPPYDTNGISILELVFDRR